MCVCVCVLFSFLLFSSYGFFFFTFHENIFQIDDFQRLFEIFQRSAANARKRAYIYQMYMN